MTGTVCLSSTFCRARGGGGGEDAGLDEALWEFWERGRAAWPGVPLEGVALATFLGERAPADALPLAWLKGLSAGDLFLACACRERVPEALPAFEAAFLGQLGMYLSALRPTPELLAETRQILLEKLFVGRPDRPPKIHQYTGQGALGAWVRVAAIRTATNLLAADRGRQRRDLADGIVRALVPAGDPEIDLLRATYKEEFFAAFRAAVLGLSRRERAILRFTFVDRLTPAEIGTMYGVHRTTAMRWVEAAEAQLLSRTRAGMMERLRLSPSECAHAISMVKSRMDHTINTLLATAQ